MKNIRPSQVEGPSFLGWSCGLCLVGVRVRIRVNIGGWVRVRLGVDLELGLGFGSGQVPKLICLLSLLGGGRWEGGGIILAVTSFSHHLPPPHTHTHIYTYIHTPTPTPGCNITQQRMWLRWAVVLLTCSVVSLLCLLVLLQVAISARQGGPQMANQNWFSETLWQSQKQRRYWNSFSNENYLISWRHPIRYFWKISDISLDKAFFFSLFYVLLLVQKCFQEAQDWQVCSFDSSVCL